MVQHIVSPVDVVKLFDSVLATISEALLLPGVDDDPTVELLQDCVRADRLFFVAKGWQVVADPALLPRCISALTHAEGLLTSKKSAPALALLNETWKQRFGASACPPVLSVPRATLLSRVVAAKTSAMAFASAPQLAAMRAAELAASPKAKGGSGAGAKERDEDAADAPPANAATASAAENLQEFVACTAFTQFPPDFQVAPCKAAFVDIAGTYAEEYYPTADGGPAASATVAGKSNSGAAAGGAQQQQGGAKPAEAAAGWFGWLRGK